jgi:hypothetical protein
MEAEKRLFIRQSTQYNVEAVGQDQQCPLTYASYQLEHYDNDAKWFRREFLGHDHKTVLAKSEVYGPVIISFLHESKDAQSPSRKDSNRDKNPTTDGDHTDARYLAIIRRKGASDVRKVITEAEMSNNSVLRGKPSTKSVIKYLFPELEHAKLKKVHVQSSVEKRLMEIDEIQVNNHLDKNMLHAYRETIFFRQILDTKSAVCL